MTKMASHESNEEAVKSSIADKVNTTVQSNMDEKKSPTASLPVDRHDEPNDTATDTKEKTLTLDTTNDCTSVEKNDSDNIKSENKDLKPLVIDKRDDETDKKQETQNVASLADPQSTDEEKEIKEIKIEDSKDSSTKGGSVLKRKRKTLRLIPYY